jgi:3-hydroxybutyryl-CoA dehydrogenase
MKIEALQTIGVIGTGTMGQGIAQVCAQSGYEVLLYDAQPEQIKSALLSIEKNTAALVEKGRLSEEQRKNILLKIRAVEDFRQLQVDLVIEAIVEKLEVKQKIFLELEKINSSDCIFVSNTSSISITEIASVLKHQGRFAGLHFFNPATIMKLVEIISGAKTNEETVNTLQNFSEKLLKITVLANDSPGFIVNRIARLFYVESLKALEEKTADFKTIDALMKNVGFKMGPFELMDLIGVDTNFAVTTSMYEAFHHEPRFRPSKIQQQKVNAGHLGRKSGKGFYEY